MAGDCTAYKTRYGSDGTFCPSKALVGDNGSVGKLKGFEVIDGLLYRRKLERGFINYREVLDAERRHEAVSTFHRRPGTRHLSLEDTYKAVAENYWWEDMYFQIREHVLGCPECLGQRCHRPEGGEGCLSKTVAPHSRDVLSQLRSQREAGLFCDITLRTDGRSYCAHRAVLAAVSEYFQEIFAETDANSKTDVDLTGFSEENLLSLLDFSYSSTLSVRQENLQEVSAMARHLGMWPAVDACSALQREQEHPSPRCPRTEPSGRGLPATRPGSHPDFDHRQRRNKRVSMEEDGVDNGFSLTLDASDESVAESPRRSLRGPSRPPPRDLHVLPLSPTHRMKLLDFKSPSCKSRSPGSSLQSPSCKSRSPGSSPQSPSHSRLLRSTPGAAQQVLKLLPRPESPRRNKRSYPVHRVSDASGPQAGVVGLLPGAVVEQEDEEDYARAQEKYRLMLVLGLQRTALLPRPEDLIGWRQKKRLRKLKANNYSLTKRRKPRPQLPEASFRDLSLSLPLCNPVNTRFLGRVVKTEPREPISVEEMRLKRPRHPRRVPPSDRSMRSREGLSDLLQAASRPTFGGRELRQSVRGGDGTPLPVRHPPPRHGNMAPTRNVVRIKPEPVDYSISGPSNGCRGHAQTHRPPPPPPRVQASNGTVAMESFRTLRYNGGRPAANLGRSTMREEPRERACRAGAGGLQGGVREEPRERACRAGAGGLQGGVREEPRERARQAGAGGPQGGVREEPRERARQAGARGPQGGVREEPRERACRAGAGGLQGGVREEPRERARQAGAGGPQGGVADIYAHPLYTVIKEEPSDPVPVTGPFPDPPSPDLGKRQSKPPIKLLDPGFLFSFCRPAGGAPAVGSVKREEESVDICLTRSVSQGQRFRAEESQHRVLRARTAPPPLPPPLKRVKRSEGHGRAQRSHSHQNSKPYLARPAGSKVTRDMPKRQGKLLPLSSKKCVLLDSIRRARLKQLRGPRSQAPKGPKAAHTCPQCHATYRDCDALTMHRLRHVEGKQWPCPLCSKTFFRLRNVRNHIRTHDQKLYKCRSCIAAVS